MATKHLFKWSEKIFSYPSFKLFEIHGTHGTSVKTKSYTLALIVVYNVLMLMPLWHHIQSHLFLIDRFYHDLCAKHLESRQYYWIGLSSGN